MRSVELVLCLCLCLGARGEGGEREARLVRSPQGPVKGYKDPGDSIFVFYGIPYATAPTGADKFKAPLPASTWLEPLEAVDDNIICPQAELHHVAFENKTKQENCLIANVFVPDTNQKKLPVVVYVHGGAYQVGFGNLHTPKNLARSKRVIVVTFNYRLGVHGFLCLGTEKVPGNAGMKDQVQLLHWVKRNIASYGGNPEDVTLAGYSAGSSAVDLLMISPITRELFNKVISDSGSNLAPWSVQVDPLENAKIFAKSNGFENVVDVYALEEFYTTASYDVLTSDPFMDRTDFTFVFSPCIERNTEGAFLTESPYNILKNGNYRKVPVLLGFAGMEGLFRLNLFETWKDKMNADFSAFLPQDLQFESEEQKAAVVKNIKEFYFGKKPVSADEESVLSYINFMSDLYFTYSTLRALNLHVNAGHDKIFLYEYNFVEDSTPIVPHTQDVRGATHCAQTIAVLDGSNIDVPSEDESNISDELRTMKKLMRELWLNFMMTGSPVPAGSGLPAWPAAGAGGAPHMSLARTLRLRGALLEERARFWDAIYERHYRAPAPPPPPPARRSEL
ncbi:esterase FE4-like [Ostrinia nubilalis]|uniref:esterase FE4-like n=1 Tax=Ostrinia nubilalis TaxID=29057 RepID=UPI0030823043